MCWRSTHVKVTRNIGYAKKTGTWARDLQFRPYGLFVKNQVSTVDYYSIYFSAWVKWYTPLLKFGWHSLAAMWPIIYLLLYSKAFIFRIFWVYFRWCCKKRSFVNFAKVKLLISTWYDSMFVVFQWSVRTFYMKFFAKKLFGSVKVRCSLNMREVPGSNPSVGTINHNLKTTSSIIARFSHNIAIANLKIWWKFHFI